MIYLDHAATTPVPRAVADTMYTVLTEHFGNPSAQYPMGLETKKQVELWRRTVAKALGCAGEELYFTSCGSEGDNWAIAGAVEVNRRKGKHIITTAIEHSAVIEPCKELERRGYEVTWLKPDRQGNITPQQVEEALRQDTVLVSMMLVNNELGTIYPIQDIARGLAAKNPQTLLHTDAVQGFLKIPFSAKTLGADFITISAHKIGGPKGIGALYLSDRLVQAFRPPYLGGEQERGLRPGTENTPYIVGLGLAAAKGAKNLSDRNAHIRALNAQLRTGLEELAQQAPITLNSPADAVPEVLNFSTNCVNSQTFIEYLSGRHIYISGGSACDKGEPSHTLMAMGAPDLAVRTALRVSFCGDNTPEDVQALLDGLKDGLKELQHI